MELKEAVTRSISEAFALFQMRPLFLPEMTELATCAEDQICVLISFSQVLKGKVVFKFNKSLGEKIAASVTGTSVTSFDEATKLALGEIMLFTASLALGKFMVNKDVSLLPPILIKGKDLSSMVSRIETNNLVFQLYDSNVSVTYCLE